MDADTFPAEAVARFTLLPATPFGGPPDDSLTATRGSNARMHWDSNIGRSWIENSEPIDPVDVTARFSDQATFAFKGNMLTVSGLVEDRERLTRLLDTVYYGFPLALSLEFLDAPAIVLVEGEVGGHPFHWGLAESQGPMDVVDTDLQEERSLTAIRRFAMMIDTDNRRLISALHSFRIAGRLRTSVHIPLEFGGERILNLAKSLEALFPPGDEDTGTIDAARKGLASLGFSDDEIEAYFIPAIALRNSIDVGHVFLNVLNQIELVYLHDYADQAESHFRDLLRRVCTSMEEGEFVPEPYDDSGPRREVQNIIRRMSQARERVEAHKTGESFG
ncbi:MAG: hypothetical protein WD556_07370 [Actinomycetota bacterium]